MKTFKTSLVCFCIAAIVSLAIVAPKNLIAENRAPQSKAPQTLCPMRGEKINPNVHADYQGKRIYFCCPGCIEEFKKNAAKIIKEIESKGIILDVAQVKCPMQGGKVKAELYADYNGRRFHFCCPGCVEKFKQNPAKYAAQVDKDTTAASTGRS